MLTEYKKLEESLLPLNELNRLLNLSSNELKQLENIIQVHPMRVSAYYMSLIDWNDPNDPIRQMAIPSLDESNLDGFYDTSGEAENTKMPGLQHMYAKPLSSWLLTGVQRIVAIVLENALSDCQLRKY